MITLLRALGDLPIFIVCQTLAVLGYLAHGCYSSAGPPKEAPRSHMASTSNWLLLCRSESVFLPCSNSPSWPRRSRGRVCVVTHMARISHQPRRWLNPVVLQAIRRGRLLLRAAEAPLNKDTARLLAPPAAPVDHTDESLSAAGFCCGRRKRP